MNEALEVLVLGSRLPKFPKFPQELEKTTESRPAVIHPAEFEYFFGGVEVDKNTPLLQLHFPIRHG